jgi:hypothetical protein
VLATVGPQVDGLVLEWLREQCAPLPMPNLVRE